MPLQLNSIDPSFDLRKRVVWDPEIAEQIMEAQTKVESLRGLGYTVHSSEPGEMVLYPPERNKDQVLMRVLDATGDTKLVWDRRDQAQVDEARVKFNQYLMGGYRGYVCRSDGTKGRRVETFDALLEEIILLQKPDANKRDQEMGWKPAEVVMVPKTMPG